MHTKHGGQISQKKQAAGQNADVLQIKGTSTHKIYLAGKSLVNCFGWSGANFCCTFHPIAPIVECMQSTEDKWIKTSWQQVKTWTCHKLTVQATQNLRCRKKFGNFFWVGCHQLLLQIHFVNTHTWMHAKYGGIIFNTARVWCTSTRTSKQLNWPRWIWEFSPD